MDSRRVLGGLTSGLVRLAGVAGRLGSAIVILLWRTLRQLLTLLHRSGSIARAKAWLTALLHRAPPPLGRRRMPWWRRLFRMN